MELKKYRLGDIAEILISSIDKKTKAGEAPVRLRNLNRMIAYYPANI